MSQNNNQLDSFTSNFRPRLIEFYGLESEDFRHFKRTLETFFSIMGINSNARRMMILTSQLKRAASVYFNRYLKTKLNDKGETDVTYEEAIKFLQSHYVTPELIQRFNLAFNDMRQGPDESPEVFLSRLYEAAELAEIDDDYMIQGRFRAGLLQDIKRFCIQSSANTFNEWVTHANGYWNAHHSRDIHLVDNPFVIPSSSRRSTDFQSSNEEQRPTRVRFMDTPTQSSSSRNTSDDVQSLKANKDKITNETPTDSQAAKLNSDIDFITNQLKTLALHQMEQVGNSQVNTPECSKCRHHPDLKEKDLQEIIREAIQSELRNMNMDNSQGYRSRRGYSPRPYYNGDNNYRSSRYNDSYYNGRTSYNNPDFNLRRNSYNSQQGESSQGYSRNNNRQDNNDNTTATSNATSSNQANSQPSKN